MLNQAMKAGKVPRAQQGREFYKTAGVTQLRGSVGARPLGTAGAPSATSLIGNRHGREPSVLLEEPLQKVDLLLEKVVLRDEDVDR